MMFLSYFLKDKFFVPTTSRGRNENKIANLFLALLFFFPFISFSQDIIQLKSGKEMKVKIIKVGDTEIEYKKSDNPDGPLYAVNKEDVASFDFNKEGRVTQNQGMNTNSSDAAIKLLKEEIKRDSLYLHSIRKLQEDMNAQNQKISGDISRLLEKWLEQDAEYQNNLKKQRGETQKQQEQLQQQVDKIAGNVSTISSTLANSSSEKEEATWIPKPLGFGINVNGLLTSNGIAKQDGIFYLTLTPGPHFRIEAEYCALLAGTSSNYYFAGGMLGMWQYGKTNGYAGLKLIRTSDYNITILNPTIGAEYAFASHFSIGCELGFPFATDKTDAAINIALTRIILRFYIGGR